MMKFGQFFWAGEKIEKKRVKNDFWGLVIFFGRVFYCCWEIDNCFESLDVTFI